MMARECGYRLEIETVSVEDGRVALTLRNAGKAPFREEYSIHLQSGDSGCSMAGNGAIESGESRDFVFTFRPGGTLAAGVAVRGRFLELGNEMCREDSMIRIQ